MKISILHPFTPKAAGVVEKSVSTYHSQPHLKAMQQLKKEFGYEVSMEYFTSKSKCYNYDFDNVKFKFYPVNFKLNGDHKKWKKQISKSCMKAYQKEAADVTIINMSAHASSFCHNLAKELCKQQKPYVPMLGGQHYTNTIENIEYYQNAHHILVHTYLQKQEMELMKMFEGKDIRVFPLGVNTNDFVPSKAKTDNKAPQLLYVGRIVEWKRIHLAIESISALRKNGFENAHLNIIGPVTSEEYLKQLLALVKKENLEQNVSFLGHKEHEELPEYFQNADLFTLPSDKETFGMVMIESMACGTPVAGIDCPGGPADVITNGVNGLLSSPNNYVGKIVNYFKNSTERKLIENAARQKVVREYSIEATYEVLKSSVQDAIK